MRRVLVTTAVVFLIGVVSVVSAQRPRVSPRRTADATVDGVHVALEYGSPFKRGRVVWGTLVPFGKWWMPGADESTEIKTSAPLMVATLLVPAGSHTLYSVPDDPVFLLAVNKDTNMFHTRYNAGNDLGRVPMTKTLLTEPVESMTFAIEAHPDGGGVLKLSWDDREYSVVIGAPRPR